MLATSAHTSYVSTAFRALPEPSSTQKYAAALMISEGDAKFEMACAQLRQLADPQLNGQEDEYSHKVKYTTRKIDISSMSINRSHLYNLALLSK
jgi:hypothetical protein